MITTANDASLNDFTTSRNVVEHRLYEEKGIVFKRFSDNHLTTQRTNSLSVMFILEIAYLLSTIDMKHMQHAAA